MAQTACGGVTVFNKVDIIDVMLAVQRGEMKIRVRNGFFLLEHTRSGECVRLNKIDAETTETKDLHQQLETMRQDRDYYRDAYHHLLKERENNGQTLGRCENL